VQQPTKFELVVNLKAVRYDRKADSGNVIAMNFCAHCHGLLWSVPVTPGIKVARAGTLDNMDWAEPVGNSGRTARLLG